MKRLTVVIALLGAMVFFAPPAHAVTDHKAAIVGTTAPYFGAGTCDAVVAGPIVIPLGDSITWTNCDSIQHTVTFNQFGSGNLNKDATYSHTFTVPGQYAYHCNIHSFMTGQVTVTGSVPTQPPATQPSTTTTRPTTTTSTTLSTTTTTAVDISGVFDDSTTTSSSTSSTTDTTISELAGGSDDSNDSKGVVIFLLLVAIAGVGGGGYYALRRMRTT